MKNSISMLLSTGLLATATGCSSLPPMKGNPWDRDVNYAIEEGKETERFEGKSDFTVILFPEDHYLYGCQANIYLALEKAVLAGEAKFVAREGRVGPTEHDNEDFQNMRYFDRNLEIGYYKDLINLPFEQRQQQARSWVQNHDFPSWYLPNINDDPVRDWTRIKPMIASVLNESVYQWVHTIGVESQKAFDKADEERGKAEEKFNRFNTLQPDSWLPEEEKKLFNSCKDELSKELKVEEIKDELKSKKLKEEIFTRCKDKFTIIEKSAFLVVRDEQIKYRNVGFVTNIQKYASKLNFVEGPLVLFPVGSLHVPDLTKQFRNESISYRVMEHKACVEE